MSVALLLNKECGPTDIEQPYCYHHVQVVMLAMINTRKPRWATGSISSISPTALAAQNQFRDRKQRYMCPSTSWQIGQLFLIAQSFSDFVDSCISG
jgi:hypothetical protein